MAKSPSTISQIKPNESNVAYAALGSERRTVWLVTPCAFAVAGTLDEVQSVAICKTCGALSGSGVFFDFVGKLVVDISQGCSAFTYELAEFKHFVLYSGKTNGFYARCNCTFMWVRCPWSRGAAPSQKHTNPKPSKITILEDPKTFKHKTQGNNYPRKHQN